MRVLHVGDAGGWRACAGGMIPDGGADDAAAVCGALLARADRHEHRCLVLGPAWFVRRARTLGLNAEWSECPALGGGRAALGWRAVRRAAEAMAAEAVCCWGVGAESAATAGLGRGVPLVRVDLGGEGSAGRIPGLHASRREVVDARSLATPPLVRAGGNGAGERDLVRRELGLAADDVAVLLLGNRGDASAVRFEFALGLSRHTGTRVVGVLPAWADSLARARAFQRKLEHTVRLESFTRPWTEALGAVDLGVWMGGGRSATWPAEGRPSPLHVRSCLAAGVPVVAPVGMGVEELFPPEARDVCLAEVANPPEVARRLIPLVEDPDLRRRMAVACGAWRRGEDGLDLLASRLAEALVRVTNTGGWAGVVSEQFAHAPGPASHGAVRA